MTLRELLETTLKVYVKEIPVRNYDIVTRAGFCFAWSTLIKNIQGDRFTKRIIFALRKCMRILEIRFADVMDSDYFFEKGDTLSRADALHRILNSENEIIQSTLAEDLGSVEFNFN